MYINIILSSIKYDINLYVKQNGGDNYVKESNAAIALDLGQCILETRQLYPKVHDYEDFLEILKERFISSGYDEDDFYKAFKILNKQMKRM